MTMGWYQDGLRATAERAGHPLSCSIWKDAVCDCTDTRDLCRECGFPGGHWGSCATAGAREPGMRVVAVADHNLDHDYSEPNDTERPPASVDGRDCYFCGEPATELVHVDMPACDSCKCRAVGRRGK